MAGNKNSALRIYSNETVFDAALNRIRRLFSEFDVVLVNVSGGKDSTVVLNLALMVAEELGRLPLPVLFVDQEAEWENVIEHIREIMSDPRVDPYWLQIPFKMTNGTAVTSSEQQRVYLWDPAHPEDWLREKEPNSIKENVYGEMRFAQILDAMPLHHWPDKSVAQLAGVRAEESPARLKGLTSYATYKDITWGRKHPNSKKQFTFYPIYDWAYTDVWKAIHDNNWAYCDLYNYLYNYGIPVRNMRVSNVHHETAIDTLRFMQEIEPETWDRIAMRVHGANAVSKVREAYTCPKELPPMFSSWREYRDHLLDNLIADPVQREKFRHAFELWDQRYVPEIEDQVTHMEIATLLVNDIEFSKCATFEAAHGMYLKGAGAMKKSLNMK